MRFDPQSALEGSFRGIRFQLSSDRRRGGHRGPVHEYPDRDLPYFEMLGRNGKRFDVTLYFVGADADSRAERFEAALWKGEPGPLVLPGGVRETVAPQSWDINRGVGKADWVEGTVAFVESGKNEYPAPQTSWPHRVLDAVDEARTAFGDILSLDLSLEGLTQEAAEALIGSVGTLGEVLDVAGLIVGGVSPASALALASELVGDYVGAFDTALGLVDLADFATSTVELLGRWADALAGSTPDRESRTRAIDGLFTVYDEAASDYWYAPAALTPLEAAQVANQAAYSAGIRRVALAEVARLSARLDFASYDDAVALRRRLADAFDDELDAASGAPAASAALQDLRSAALGAISAAGADKARLVPYQVPRPRPALALAQLFYGDDPDVASRATELVARTGAIHPAFLPARAERLSR